MRSDKALSSLVRTSFEVVRRRVNVKRRIKGWRTYSRSMPIHLKIMAMNSLSASTPPNTTRGAAKLSTMKSAGRRWLITAMNLMKEGLTWRQRFFKGTHSVPYHNRHLSPVITVTSHSTRSLAKIRREGLSRAALSSSHQSRCSTRPSRSSDMRADVKAVLHFQIISVSSSRSQANNPLLSQSLSGRLSLSQTWSSRRSNQRGSRASRSALTTMS